MSGNSKQYYEEGSQIALGLKLLQDMKLRWLTDGLAAGQEGSAPCQEWNYIYMEGYRIGRELAAFQGAPKDWPTWDEITVIEARHRGSVLEAVSWNTGPYLFDEVGG